MAERGLAKWNREYKMQPVTTDGLITIRPGLSTQLLVPGIATPVDLSLNHGGMDQIFVFAMSQEEVKEKRKAENDEFVKVHPEAARLMAGAAARAPAATVLALLRPTPRRGAIIHPLTTKDVDADVAGAKTLGLNTLWLDVFSDGVAHLPGSVLSGGAAAKTADSDILAEALARTKGMGIRVFALFDLLFWGQTPPASDADLNILGETSAQAAARWQQRKALLPEGQSMSEENYANAVIPDWPGVAVSPLAPDVQNALVGYMKTVAARSGIAGLVWRDTDTPGYDLLPGGSDTSSLLLGYQIDVRLAFLRRFHADPVDIYDVGHSGTIANTDLPNFTDQGSGNLMYTLHDDWVKFRQDRGLTFLQSLYAAINPPSTLVARRVPIFVRQRRRGQGGNDGFGKTHYPPGWYGSWDNPRLPPPTLHTMGEDNKPGQPDQPVPDETVQAKSQSQIVLTPITSDWLDQMRQAMSYVPPANAKQPARRVPLPGIFQMPGFVLDLDKTSSGEDPLPALAAEVTAAKAAPK